MAVYLDFIQRNCIGCMGFILRYEVLSEPQRYTVTAYFIGGPWELA
jgi:hypothetical protein